MTRIEQSKALAKLDGREKHIFLVPNYFTCDVIIPLAEKVCLKKGLARRRLTNLKAGSDPVAGIKPTFHSFKTGYSSLTLQNPRCVGTMKLRLKKWSQ